MMLWDIWNAVKARFGGNAESKKIRKSMLKQEFSEFRIGEAEGLHKGYDRMQKIMSQLNQLKAKPEDEDINLKFLRALPSSWSQTLEVDVKGYSTFSSSQSVGSSHSAFVSPTSASKKMSYGDSLSYSSNTTYSTSSNSKIGFFKQIEKLDLKEMDLKWQMAMLSVRVHKFEQKTKRKIDFDKKESARFNKKKVRCYKCQQRGHFARECRAKGGNDKQRYSSFKIKEIGKKEEDSKALITIDTLVEWTDHDDESAEVITAKEFGVIAGCDSEDAIKEGAAKIYNLITRANSEEANTASDAGEFALIGVTFESTSQMILPPVHQLPVDKVNHKNKFVPQAVLLRTDKVNIPPVRPQPVPTGKPKVSAPVSTGKPKVSTHVPTGKPKVSTPVLTGRPNRPSPFPTDRGFSPSVIFEKVYTGYLRTIVDLIHLHTDDNVADLLTKAFDGPRVFNSSMLHLLRVEMVINSPWIMPILGTKEMASPEQTAPGRCHDSTKGLANPIGEMKAITTRSGVVYEGPSIPTNPSPKKVVEREIEETTYKEQTNFQGKLANRPITLLKGVVEDVFIKLGKFHFLIDFVVVDFEADPRVPLILWRSFLRTGRSLIDVYREEITLWVNDDAVIFNLNQTTRYSSTYDDLLVN
nr:ribonuclease H-like domain-containing protein [Tanacetum cinerariifolium]